MKYLLPTLLILLFSSCQHFGEAIILDETTVFYKEKGLKAVAERTATYLDEKQFTQGTINAIQITRDTMYNVRIVLSEELAYDQRLQSNFKVLGTSIAEAVFDGSDINFQLCDTRFRTLRTIPINQSRL